MKDLTKGTQEYKDALVELGEEELKRYKKQQEEALTSAKINLQNSKIGSGIRFTEYLDSFMESRGFEVKGIDLQSFGDILIGDLYSTFDLGSAASAEEAIEQYEKLLEIRDHLQDFYLRHAYDEDDYFLDRYGFAHSSLAPVLSSINSEIERVKPLISQYNEAQKALGEIADVTEEITKDSAEWRNSIDQIGTGTLDTLVEKLKEARDATKDAYDYENKKKAVLEAEKALLDAQNNRTVRVYNRQTGTWEFASSAKEVQEAQENLDKARLEIEQAAYDEIIKLLEDGDSTNEALLKVMAHWAAAYGSGDFSGVSNTIKSIVKEATGVDLNTGIIPEKKPTENVTKTFW